MTRLTQLVRLTPLALALCPAAVWADTGSEIAELKARLQQLELQVREQAARPAPAPAVAAAPATTGAGGLQIGDTRFSLKGYVKLDALSSSFSEGEVGRVTGRDFYVPNAIPVFGGLAPAGNIASPNTAGANGKSRNFYDMHAKQTRFIVDTETPTAGGDTLKGHLEMDFLSSTQGDERITNGYSPELRQAWLSYGKWLAGQAWSTFQDLGALPETVDFVGSSDGSVFVRQPQLRYTTGPWQLSAENSQTVVGDSSANATGTLASGSTASATAKASAGPIETNDNAMPDLVARYTYKSGFGHLSLAALGRQIKAKNPVAGGVNTGSAETGYGLSLSGKIKTVGQDDIRFMLTSGRAIGRYLALNTANDAVLNTATGELEPIRVSAGYVTYHHAWNDRLRSNLQVSAFHAGNPASITPDATRSVHSGLVNLIYAATPKLDLGVEALHARRKVEGGAEGSLDRLQFMAKYNF